MDQVVMEGSVMLKRGIAICICAILAACSAPQSEPQPLTGDWTLVPESSQIAFVSIKAGNVGEAHSFKTESGVVDGTGKAEISIDLSSVDTAVDIRDERMREFLFQVDQFPSATITAQIDPETMKTLDIGEQQIASTELSLSLHGIEADFDSDLAVTRISENRVLVETTKPVIIDATQFALGDGLEKLRELAELPSISPAVPVTATLIFARNDK
ncbi:YceI family protein [Alterisphingorhabdus coralli]|uniref:YceI family protein n=1 Tax=Alterisphingorhabdus coralli TaxID=3071408 RepID=A0AA97HZZ0_9SPHN|nr:YceI family protein [Parasphingorhabdus sp. SCSIO 66989]WOE73893.1 YceI family protein [Parasphingorhabdus sp. SCSIO 66989]